MTINEIEDLVNLVERSINSIVSKIALDRGMSKDYNIAFAVLNRYISRVNMYYYKETNEWKVTCDDRAYCKDVYSIIMEFMKQESMEHRINSALVRKYISDIIPYCMRMHYNVNDFVEYLINDNDRDLILNNIRVENTLAEV